MSRLEKFAKLFQQGKVSGLDYARVLAEHGATASARQLARRTVRDWFVNGVWRFDYGADALRCGVGCFTEKQAALVALEAVGQIDWHSKRNWHEEFETAQLPKPRSLAEVRERLKAYQSWLRAGGLERTLC